MRSTADAVDRETAWLSAAGDNLPALQKVNGGPFDDVHAYFPIVPDMTVRTLYVLRRTISQDRFGGQRIINSYPMRLIAWWPLLGGPGFDGSAEAEQRALDAALDLVIQRLVGPVGDKTHGGRFMSAGENPRRLDAEFNDPTVTLPEGYVRADLTYSVDDFEYPG